MRKNVYIADPLDFQSAGIHRYVRGWTDHWPLQFGKDENHLIRFQPVEEKGWQVHGVKGMLPGKIGRYTRKLTSIPSRIHKIDPDVVIESAHFGPYRLGSRVKRFVTIHDISPITRPSNHTFYSEYAHKYLLKPTLRSADGIIVNSEKTKHEVADVMRIPTELIQVVYPGIEDHFRPVSDLQKIRETGVDRPYFLHVGTIEPRKQIHQVIHSFEQWCRANPREEDLLVMVGKMGWKMHAFHRILRNSPFGERILWLEYVEDEVLPILYSGASALIFLSIDEGFGFPVAEALYCGCPVISGQCKVFKESGGKLPLVVDSNDPDEVSDAMTRVKDISVDAKEAREKLAHLDWEKSFKNLSEFLDQF